MRLSNSFTYFILIFFSCLLTNSYGQICDTVPIELRRFEGNRVSTALSSTGLFWWNGEREDAGIYTPYTYGRTASTLFSAGLWLGGIGLDNSPRVAAARTSPLQDVVDLYSGPLNRGTSLTDPVRGTPLAENCTDWNKIWEVRRHEWEAFRADFAEDGIVHGYYPGIYAWPGSGNPFFFTFNGFSLPRDIPQGLAPFFDQNEDGIYNPSQGDYPHVSQSLEQPVLLTWTIFHDAGPHNLTDSPEPLQFEIQHTAWAYDCETHPWLNETIFSSFKVTNVGTERIDSVYLGIRADFDLGCYSDDYMGTAPDIGSIYVYNADDEDGRPCQGSINTFTSTPPVQAITFLNSHLTNSMYYSILGGAFPFFNISPTAYYQFLSGTFSDGNPLTIGGTGYNPEDSTAVPTPYAYPDLPTETEGWSMYQANIVPEDFRMLGSSYLDQLEPDASWVVDVASSYHHHPDSSHLQNVNLMYNQVADLHELYEQQFESLCTPRTICVDDCVWAGDANADGIADHKDLLAILHTSAENGATRNPPIAWLPQAATPWLNALPIDATVNAKHADCNGDGQVTITDFTLTERYYKQEQPGYVAPSDDYPEGPELLFRTWSSGDDLLDVGVEESIRCDVFLTESVPDLRGIALTVEYDLDFLAPMEIFNGTVTQFLNERSDGRTDFVDVSEPGELHIATFSANEDFRANNRIRTRWVILRLREDALTRGLPNDTTYLRIKNVVAYDSQGNRIELGAQTTVLTISDDIAVSTNEIIVTNKYQLFPNPVSEVLEVRGLEGEVQAYQILDVSGRVCQRKTGNWQGQLNIDVSALSGGLYYLQLEQEGHTLRPEKFVRL